MQTKAIIFDKDGTLIDFDGFWVTISENVIDEVIEKIGVAVPKDELLASIGVKNGVASIKGELCAGTYESIGKALYLVAKKHGYKNSFDEFYSIVMNSFDCNFDKGILKPTCSNLKETLKTFLDLGLKLFVVTTDNKAYTEKCLEQLNIRHFFTELLTDDGEIPTKPDPKAIEIITKKYNLSKDEIVMVGDTLTDMRFAENGNIKGIGVAKNKENTDILLLKTDIVVKEISQLLEVIE